MDIPLGTGSVSVDLPNATVARPDGGETVQLEAAVEDAVADPHGPPLSERVEPDDTVAIVTTDMTRATPTEQLLDVLMAELIAGGVDRSQVTIIVGSGLHRPLTAEELYGLYGDYAELAVNHDAEETVEVGTVDDVPVMVHPAVATADVVCATGIVEPHQYAGFSGGAKTVAIGAGGEPLIEYTHGPEMLAKDGVRLGRTDDNPFRACIERAGDVIGIDFCLNITHGPDGPLGASAGDHRAVVQDLAATAREALAVPIAGSYETVITGVGAPKDGNLYQATRGPTYVALGPYDPLSDNGRLIVPATLAEGLGSGTGERRFHEWLSNATSPQDLYETMLDGYAPGAQRAFILAQVLLDHEVVVTDSRHRDLVEECLLSTAETLSDAVDEDEDVLVVPQAINTLLVDGS